MKTKPLALILLAALFFVPALPARAAERREREGRNLGIELLLYIPNRVLDLFDMVRARLRVGPGLAAGVRATEPLSIYVGGYASVYAGLPGPRQRPWFPIPVGLETHTGVTASVADATLDAGIGPDYSPTEVGASLHLLIVGADVGVDPMEIVDFLAGFILMDPRGDDF